MSDTSQGPGWWQASDGKWYAPQGPPGNYAQPPTMIVQKKGHGCLYGILGAGVLVIILIIVLVNVGSSSSKPGSGSSAHPATADVTVACGKLDEIGVPHATLTILNHSSGRSDYSVHVEFDNAQGNRVDDGYGLENDIAPGQSATTDMGGSGGPSDTSYSTCKILTVERTASTS